MITQIVKSNLLKVSLVFFALFTCSCNPLHEPKKEGLIYCEVVGELYHKQYWDKNDSWDLKNMLLLLHYDDGTSESISATSSNAHYVFEPSSPVGLSHDVKKFRLIEGTYTDYKGDKHPIIEREFYPVTIVDYPKNRSKNLFIEIMALICFSGTAIIGLLVYKKYKDK